MVCISFSAQSLESSMLVEKALEARKRAYAPYSHHFVGAALLGKSGKIYVGCNVENASYGLTNCAEQVAVCSAISENERDFKAIAIITKSGGICCGACRQVLNEFNPNIRIICANERGEIRHEFTLDQILPHSFGPNN